MYERMEEFIDLLEKVISYGDIKDFEEFKKRVIEELEEVDR